MPLESSIRKNVNRVLKSFGPIVYAVNYHGNQFSVTGTPDIIACVNGRFLTPELKQPGKEPTLVQKIRANEIQKAGGETIVATHHSQVEDKVNQMLSGEFSCTDRVTGGHEQCVEIARKYVGAHKGTILSNVVADLLLHIEMLEKKDG